MKLTSFISSVIFLGVFTKVKSQDGKGYDTEYPQYLYKPPTYGAYEAPCNQETYDVYLRQLSKFKQEWYDNERYPKYSIPREYQDRWDTYGGRYQSYDDDQYVDLTANLTGEVNPCCWTFRGRLPRRRLDKNLRVKRLRKEYRQLTASERTAFHNALNQLKTNGDWDVFVSNHRQSNSPFAHNGACFLPWHREFLFRLENALILNGFKLGLPYFDSTLDQSLPVPSDSAVWTDDYLGNNDGPVTTGFAANWQSIPGCSHIGVNLTRRAIDSNLGQCFLLSDFDVNYVYTKRCFRDITCNTDCKFEADHAGVHNFVGGHMGNPSCAPSDPFFFLHHAFVDCIWEEFRQNHQESNIHKEYPSQVNGDNVGTPPGGFGGPNGFEWNNQMLPFVGLVNGHGIKKFYSKYYKCHPRPMQCKQHQDCNSEILWCDNGRCKAKVRTGGVCSGICPSDGMVCPACANCPGNPGGPGCCNASGRCQCGCLKG